jgi:hypothetical protein
MMSSRVPGYVVPKVCSAPQHRTRWTDNRSLHLTSERRNHRLYSKNLFSSGTITPRSFIPCQGTRSRRPPSAIYTSVNPAERTTWTSHDEPIGASSSSHAMLGSRYPELSVSALRASILFTLRLPNSGLCCTSIYPTPTSFGDPPSNISSSTHFLFI